MTDILRQPRTCYLSVFKISAKRKICVFGLNLLISHVLQNVHDVCAFANSIRVEDRRGRAVEQMKLVSNHFLPKRTHEHPQRRSPRPPWPSPPPLHLPAALPLRARERERASGSAAVQTSSAARFCHPSVLPSVHPPLLAQKRMDGMGIEGGEQWIIFDRAGVQCIRHSSHMDVGVASDTIPQSEFMQL